MLIVETTSLSCDKIVFVCVAGRDGLVFEVYI